MKVLVHYVFVVEDLAINKRVAFIRSGQSKREVWLKMNPTPCQRSTKKWRNLIQTLVHGC